MLNASTARSAKKCPLQRGGGGSGQIGPWSLIVWKLFPDFQVGGPECPLSSIFFVFPLLCLPLPPSGRIYILTNFLLNSHELQKYADHIVPRREVPGLPHPVGHTFDKLLIFIVQ